MNPLEVLKAFDEIVVGIDLVEFEEGEHVSMWKIKASIFDSSILWIREVYRKNELMAYSYYWLREDDSLIIGWDNAPHHQDIATFPHHKHVGEEIESSDETDLEQVLKFIDNYTD